MSQPLPPVVHSVPKCPELGFLHARANGRMIPAFIHPDAMMKLGQTWDTTEQDILICTHQKVGTHLTKKYIVEILRAAGAIDAHHPAGRGDIGKGAVPWPEVMASQHGTDAFEEFLKQTEGQPRILYTHANADELPVRHLHPKTKVVMTYRDPKGAAVSQFHFYQKHPSLGVSPDMTFDQFVALFLEGDLYFGDYHQHVQGYFQAGHHGICPKQLCILRYEDLVENKEASVRRLSRFLLGDHRLTEQQTTAVAQSTEFNTMKQAILDKPGTFHFNAHRFFRSGKTDDWKEQLTPQQSAAIDAKTRRVWGSLLAPAFQACSAKCPKHAKLAA
jgi:hypothetical protein